MAAGSSEQQLYYQTAPNSNRQHENWVQVTEIDDDDLQFGGKSLSEWYEEERRRLSHSASSDEEDRRGRQRVRSRYSSYSKQHHAKSQSSKTG